MSRTKCTISSETISAETELVDLTLAIVAIDGWNRLRATSAHRTADRDVASGRHSATGEGWF
jgi:hypothetical protein